MYSKIAYCGLDCNSCPVLIATFEKEEMHKQTLRKEISEQCFKIYGVEIRPEDISDCEGCRTDDKPLFSGCLNCNIRKCARQNNLEDCAHCGDYACEQLKEHFLHDKDAQRRLDEARSKLCSGDNLNK